MDKNKYYWEYFRKRKDGKLNRVISRELRLNEIEDYIKKDWLQADLTFKKLGDTTIYKIGHITTNKKFLTYDHKTQKFDEIPLNKIEDYIDLNEVGINNRWIYLN